MSEQPSTTGPGSATEPASDDILDDWTLGAALRQIQELRNRLSRMENRFRMIGELSENLGSQPTRDLESRAPPAGAPSPCPTPSGSGGTGSA